MEIEKQTGIKLELEIEREAIKREGDDKKMDGIIEQIANAKAHLF